MHASGPVQAVRTEEFDKVLLASPVPTVVDFWASWCGPCRRLAPIYHALAKEWAGQLTFLSVDVDAEPTLAARFGVLSIPTIKLFRSGREASTHVGAAAADELRAVLQGWSEEVATPLEAASAARR